MLTLGKVCRKIRFFSFYDARFLFFNCISFIFFSEDKKIYRGCLTDASDHRLLCEQDSSDKKGICVKCSGSGCNNMPRVRPPLLSCVHCKKSHECAFGQDKNNAVTCKSQIPFGTDESCYTRFGLGNMK